MDWIIGLQKAIDYIENNLTDTIDYEKVAAQSYSSSYHFQRVFSILCGFTIGEYIRNRRLSLAGSELATSDAKVIDVALKYGYESPDSFAKAFQKFHGILPSQARNDGSKLKTFSRLVRGGMKTSHRATIAIAILKDYWNLGIGSAMFEELVAAAQNRGTEIMELEFIEGNDRARHLYEKFGFRVVSEKPNAFKLKDGTYRNEFYMQKYLREI